MIHDRIISAAALFTAELAILDVKLPLALSDEDVGVILDADKRGILTVDVNGEAYTDEQATCIAEWIVCAVNTCGGFKAKLEPARG